MIRPCIGGIATLHPPDVDPLPEVDLLQACLQAVPDAVLVSDESGSAVYLNRAAETLSGWSSGHAVGKSITEIWRIEGNASLSALKFPTATFRQAVLSNKDGQCVEIEQQTTLVVNKYGRSAGFIIVA
jgi:PAS domain S-box-containing protein